MIAKEDQVVNNDFLEADIAKLPTVFDPEFNVFIGVPRGYS